MADNSDSTSFPSDLSGRRQNKSDGNRNRNRTQGSALNNSPPNSSRLFPPVTSSLTFRVQQTTSFVSTSTSTSNSNRPASAQAPAPAETGTGSGNGNVFGNSPPWINPYSSSPYPYQSNDPLFIWAQIPISLLFPFLPHPTQLNHSTNFNYGFGFGEHGGHPQHQPQHNNNYGQSAASPEFGSPQNSIGYNSNNNNNNNNNWDQNRSGPCCHCGHVQYSSTCSGRVPPQSGTGSGNYADAVVTRLPSRYEDPVPVPVPGSVPKAGPSSSYYENTERERGDEPEPQDSDDSGSVSLNSYMAPHPHGRRQNQNQNLDVNKSMRDVHENDKKNKAVVTSFGISDRILARRGRGCDRSGRPIQVTVIKPKSTSKKLPTAEGKKASSVSVQLSSKIEKVPKKSRKRRPKK